MNTVSEVEPMQPSKSCMREYYSLKFNNIQQALCDSRISELIQKEKNDWKHLEQGIQADWEYSEREFEQTWTEEEIGYATGMSVFIPCCDIPSPPPESPATIKRMLENWHRSAIERRNGLFSNRYGFNNIQQALCDSRISELIQKDKNDWKHLEQGIQADWEYSQRKFEQTWTAEEIGYATGMSVFIPCCDIPSPPPESAATIKRMLENWHAIERRNGLFSNRYSD